MKPSVIGLDPAELLLQRAIKFLLQIAAGFLGVLGGRVGALLGGLLSADV